MPRLVFPEKFSEQLKLLTDVRARHAADGAASVLNPLLIQKEIDLDADFADGNLAETHQQQSKQLMRDAEEQKEERDVKFKPVVQHARGCIRVLKLFYSPNYRALGYWGVDVDGEAHLNFPSGFSKRVELVRAIKAKHDSYGIGGSPLENYLLKQDINLNDDASDVDDAVIAHDAQLNAGRQAEEETEQRNNLWKPVILHLRLIANYLMKLFEGNQKHLGDWGFTVDNAKRKPKLRTITVKPGSKKTIGSIILGKNLTNISTTDLHIYKGVNVSVTALIVPPNEALKMTKGFSRITIINPSTTETVKFTVGKWN